MPRYTHPVLRRDTTFRDLAAGLVWWLRYWRRFRNEEKLDRNPLRFAWHGAWRSDVYNRRNDRIKYS